MPTRRNFIQTLAAASLTPLWVRSHAHSTYPARPVTLVVATTAGGQADLIARYLAEMAGKDLGQPIIVDNRPGANGIVGLQYAARQPPDGYTLAYGTGTWMAVNRGFYPNLPYDPVRDFVPITQIGITPQCLMVGPHVRAINLAELIALAKASPGKLTFASFGNGSTSQLQGELLKQSAGIDMLHVPFKGSAQAIQEIIAGRVDMMIIDFAPAAAFIKEGRIRPLAVTGMQRYPDYPQVPTFQELGYPLTLVGWNGIFAPAKTPPAIVQRLNRSLNHAIQSDEGKARLRQLGALATGTTPEAYGLVLAEDIRAWSEVIRRAGIKPD